MKKALKYWIAGMITIILGIGLISLLIWNIEAATAVFFILFSGLAAIPVGKKVMNLLEELKKWMESQN